MLLLAAAFVMARRSPARMRAWQHSVHMAVALALTVLMICLVGRISMPYLSEVERGRKEASSEVLAAAAHALGLGLGDLLSLAQGELVRVTGRRVPGGSRARTGSSYDGLCLAA
ncbi:transcriptional regulator [Streptomyces sp. uw30]|uniref:transcriptional regulator n=1 Tax=Streptomyces sp. uw30 TaxID=1828179 RepID=UPI0021CA3199|nr:transcriptional regulator [Streptomyces sp. uw30]